MGKQGSGSWRAYGFASEEDCVAKCETAKRQQAPPEANGSTGSGRCSTAGLMFTMDMHHFDPPVWKFRNSKCLAVKEGSSSWKAYGFATEAACIAKCGKQEHEEKETAGSKKQGKCNTKGLMFTMDARRYDPPLWKFKHYRCQEVRKGSGSWQAYGFTTKADCVARCHPDQ